MIITFPSRSSRHHAPPSSFLFSLPFLFSFFSSTHRPIREHSLIFLFFFFLFSLFFRTIQCNHCPSVESVSPTKRLAGSQPAFRPFQTFSFLSLSGLFTPPSPTDRSPLPFMGFHGPGEPKRVDQKRPWILGEPVRIMPDTSRCRFTGY